MKRMKQIGVLLLCAAMITASGCAAAPGTKNEDTITVTDHAGREVTVPAQIDRIVVVDIYPLPSVLSVFFDSAEKIVGMEPMSMSAAQNSLLSELYPEILQAQTSFSGGSDLNTEELIALDPDVVFYSAGTEAVYEELQRAGIPAVAVSASKWDYNAVETLNNWIDLLGQLFPENEKTDLCRRYSEEIYEMVHSRTADLPEEEREDVFFLFQYSDAAMTTSGSHFFGQWWADAIGARNAAAELDTDNSTPVSMEQVYAWDPSVILMTNFTPCQPEDLYTNAVGSYDWSAVKAVEQERVYKMPLGMYRSYTPGIDTPITLMWLAKTVYPQYFEDIDITQETKDYYKEVFGVTLTDQQAQSIFTPPSAAAAE